jgi:phospholipid/cholesterol/gamma-HCH transport system ATP-binding protein
MAKQSTMIEIHDLSFQRHGRWILKNVNLSLDSGYITAIMGASGSGKSTLLNLITGRLRPDTGKVFLFGEQLDKQREGQMYGLWKKMGFLFQSAALFNDMTVIENVIFPISEHTLLPERLARYIGLMKLESVGLRAAADYYPHELSGGMQRRVALARAIALDPQIVFYDEPFAGQDPISLGVLVRLIKQFTEDLGITSLVVSHDISETLGIADKVIFLHDGGIYFHGSTHDFVRCQDPAVVQFVQALADGPVRFHMPHSQSLGEQFLCL